MYTNNLGALQGILVGATRCLECRDPLCIKQCPEHIDIPAAMRLIIGRGGTNKATAWMQQPDDAVALATSAIEASFEHD